MTPQKQDDNRDNKGRFVKGQSGNPGGRPKTINLNARIRDVLQRTQNGKEVADLLAEKMVAEALKNPAKMWSFLKEFIDRDEGRTDGRGTELESGTTADQTASAVRAAIEAMRGSVPDE
tara:strand:+ start:2101 stop:2457 length:357 start_codon:yes stop_codon:yes gene_type:complete